MNTNLLGIIAAFSAALIGAGWQIVTRFGVTTTVDAYDLALMRYCIPACLLLPILVRKGLFVKDAPPLILVAMVIGGGMPFGLLVVLGATLAPVSHIAVLIPGTMPIFVAALSAVVFRDVLGRQKILAFLILTIGIFCIGWEAVVTMGLDTIIGDATLLLAAFLWGVYSIAYRRSGLTPWHAAAIIAFWSAILALSIWFIGHGDGLWQTSANYLVVQLVWQGVLAGAIGMWIYGYAMQKIGPAQAATIGALVPAMAATGGWFILEEEPSTLAIVGIALTVCGVMLANRPRRHHLKALGG